LPIRLPDRNPKRYSRHSWSVLEPDSTSLAHAFAVHAPAFAPQRRLNALI
jgi:hypothetical protein